MALPTNYIETSGLTYCGTEAQEIFAKDVYNLDLRSIGATMLDGVKGRRKIYMGQPDEMWQAYTCAFSPDGQVSLSEAYIEVVPIKVNKEFCKDEFWDSFLVEQTSISLAGGMPQTFADWYFAKMRAEMAKEYQEIAWKGDTSYTGATKQFLKVADGWEKKLKAGANTISGTAFTVDNILAQVEATIASGLAVADAAEVNPENYKVLMNKNDVRLLNMALGKVCCPNNASIFSNYAKGADGKVYIYGFEVVETEQSKNTVIFGDPRNLVLAFDTYDSHISYKVINMTDHTLDNTYRIGAISNIGMGIVFPELFVISYVA